MFKETFIKYYINKQTWKNIRLTYQESVFSIVSVVLGILLYHGQNITDKSTKLGNTGLLHAIFYRSFFQFCSTSVESCSLVSQLNTSLPLSWISYISMFLKNFFRCSPSELLVSNISLYSYLLLCVAWLFIQKNSLKEVLCLT